MELQSIVNNTYFLKGGTNTGVYVTENNEAIMIDPGLSCLRTNRMIDMFENKQISLKYIINTHEHEDHYGGCGQLKARYPEVKILSTAESKIFIENPQLFANYIIGGQETKFLKAKLSHRKNEKVDIDEVIAPGKITLCGEEFEVIALPGHTSGSVGILTKDKVLFAGDLLIGEDILKNFEFLFLQDLGAYLDSLEKLRALDFDYLVLAHGKKVVDKAETEELIDKHIKATNKYLNLIKEGFKVPMNAENLLRKLIKDNNLMYNYKEYYFFRSSLISFISYLADQDEIGYKLEDSDLLYYTKTK